MVTKFRINTPYYSEVIDSVLRFDREDVDTFYFRNIHTNEEIHFEKDKIGNFELESYDLEFPEVYSLWKHKNGNIYIVRGHSNVDNERNDEYPQTVEYANFHTGECFSRKLVDWYRSMTSIRIDSF